MLNDLLDDLRRDGGKLVNVKSSSGLEKLYAVSASDGHVWLQAKSKPVKIETLHANTDTTNQYQYYRPKNLLLVDAESTAGHALEIDNLKD